MILIISEEKDVSTNHVIDWLHFYYNELFVRINYESNIELKEIKLGSNSEISFNLTVDGQEISLKDINSYWYRRGTINFKISDFNEIEDVDIRIKVKRYLQNEKGKTIEFILYLIESQNQCLGSFFKADINKLYCLKKAKEVGLDIPNTIITTDSQKLFDFYVSSDKKIITKSISEAESFNMKINNKEYIFPMHTKEVNDEHINSSDNFFPTLFQAKLNKDFELRIFYLNGQVYPMAIFSQRDEKTKLDFRNYNTTKPNRTVPFSLPDEIERKIDLLMKTIDRNTGSIDMVVTKDGKFVFLEVNPVGQFGMVGNPCNYPINKEIAKFLITSKSNHDE